MVVTFARGLGVSGGGVVRDVALQFSGNLSLSYGAVFILGFFGLLAALWVLSRVNVTAFKSAYADQQPADSATILAGAMD
jgi:hypothetical protein